MEQVPTQLEARLLAIEFLIVNLYGIENRRRGWDADRILEEHGELLARMRHEHRSARAGGVAAANVYQAVERLLSDIRAVS